MLMLSATDVKVRSFRYHFGYSERKTIQSMARISKTSPVMMPHITSSLKKRRAKIKNHGNNAKSRLEMWTMAIC